MVRVSKARVLRAEKRPDQVGSGKEMGEGVRLGGGRLKDRRTGFLDQKNSVRRSVTIIHVEGEGSKKKETKKVRAGRGGSIIHKEKTAGGGAREPGRKKNSREIREEKETENRGTGNKLS